MMFATASYIEHGQWYVKQLLLTGMETKGQPIVAPSMCCSDETRWKIYQTAKQLFQEWCTSSSGRLL